MNNHTAQHVAALIAQLFEVSATTLRQRGERAGVDLTDLDPQFIVALEVDRDRGNWQRNLVVTVEVKGHAASVSVKIYDDDRNAIARVANADVALEELGEVALAVARAGTTRLLAEVSPATAVA